MSIKQMSTGTWKMSIFNLPLCIFQTALLYALNETISSKKLFNRRTRQVSRWITKVHTVTKIRAENFELECIPVGGPTELS